MQKKPFKGLYDFCIRFMSEEGAHFVSFSEIYVLDAVFRSCACGILHKMKAFRVLDITNGNIELRAAGCLCGR